MKDQNIKALPLMCWDIYSDQLVEYTATLRKNAEQEIVREFAQKYKWQNDIDKLFCEYDYEALVITDVTQRIIWVNDGFTAMTGYTKREAVNNTPRFLQGHATTQESKKRVRKRLDLNEPFTEIVMNHKKNDIVYQCEVNIIPLYNQETTHFIAFEKELALI